MRLSNKDELSFVALSFRTPKTFGRKEVRKQGREGGTEGDLRLYALQASAPQHLAPPELHLGVVDLVGVLHLLQLLLGDLLLLGAVARRLQELQPAGGHAGHQLGVEKGGKGRSAGSVCRRVRRRRRRRRTSPAPTGGCRSPGRRTRATAPRSGSRS